MNNKRILSIDLDGTLLTTEKEITQYSQRILKRANDEGILICFVTARSLASVNELCEGYKSKFKIDYIIASDGALIYDCNKNKSIYKSIIDVEYVEYLANFAFENKMNLEYTQDNCNLLLSYDDYINANDKKEFTSINNAIFIRILHEDLDFRDKLLHYIEENKIRLEFTVTRSRNGKVYYHTITNYNVNKGNSVLKLIENLNLDKKNTYVFGNDINDISMFKLFDNCIAVENSPKTLTDVAKYITESNNDDGVCKWIENNILNNGI